MWPFSKKKRTRIVVDNHKIELYYNKARDLVELTMYCREEDGVDLTYRFDRSGWMRYIQDLNTNTVILTNRWSAENIGPTYSVDKKWVL